MQTFQSFSFENLAIIVLNILNTPIPYAAEFWNFVKSFTSSYFWAGFFVVAIVPMIWFYIYGAFFYMIDFHTSEEFKYKYKVQNNIRITFDQFIDAFNISFRNWVVLGLPYLFMVCKYNEYLYEKNGKREPVLPTVGILLRDLVVYVILEEVMFYFSHRALHWNSFYASIHKFHHKFTAPCAIASIYAHPIEHIVSNLFPGTIGPMLMASHPLVTMFWALSNIFNSMTVHSGYDLSFACLFAKPYYHDWHHEKFTENFGAVGLLDNLLGTNKQFLEAVVKQRICVPRENTRDKLS